MYNECALTLKTRMNVAYSNRHFNISTKTLVPALELALKVSVLQESFRTFFLLSFVLKFPGVACHNFDLEYNQT